MANPVSPVVDAVSGAVESSTAPLNGGGAKAPSAKAKRMKGARGKKSDTLLTSSSGNANLSSAMSKASMAHDTVFGKVTKRKRK